jgi:hypothetical protein
MVACDDEVSVGGEQTRLKTRLSYSTRDLNAIKLDELISAPSFTQDVPIGKG